MGTWVSLTVRGVFEASRTPPDAWLPHGLHSPLALWLLGLPPADLFPSYAPFTSPFSIGDAAGCSRCSAGTNGWRSSSSDIANTGTLTWSPSPWASPRRLPDWLPSTGDAAETDTGSGVAGALVGSAVPESKPKQGPVKRERRRLLVELRRRCL